MAGKIIIDLVVVGNIKVLEMDVLVKEYEKRIRKYAKLKIIELKDESNNYSNEIVLNREAKRINQVIDPTSFLIILDIDKKQYSSIEFAQKIDEITTYKNSKITFVIGGSCGLSNQIKQKADLSISFSKMTFPHQLFRVIFLEQLYRSFTILHGSKYHK